MPVGYYVAAAGRTGAELRVARGEHLLVATGKAANIGTFLPHLTTIVSVNAAGSPIEVRLPYLLAVWLVLGCLTITDEVADLLVYKFMVGAERMGAAADLLLGKCDLTLEATSPSVLRADLLRISVGLRASQPISFTITINCLIIVGGDPDNLECGALAVALLTPPISPVWCGHMRFSGLRAPDRTLIVLSEAEGALAPRWFPAQRSAGGGFVKLESLLSAALGANELAIITGLGYAGMAEQFSQLVVTLLPSAVELTSFASSPAGAALGLARAFTRAVSPSGAQTVSVYEVLTVERCLMSRSRSNLATASFLA